MIANDLRLFQEITHEILKLEAQEPVSKPIPTHRLYEELNLKLSNKGIEEEQLKNLLKALVNNTPKTSTSKFFNQLFGGRNGKAMLGDLLAVILNTSMYTYKVAGPMVGIEKEIIHQVAKLLNYPNHSDGTIATGGSMTNFMAMIMARDAHNAKISNEGFEHKMMLYTSTESHYSISKNASFMGIGRNNVRYIKSNDQGEMDVNKLEDCIEQDLANGLSPFMINATAGTTVLGAFDSFKTIGSLAKKHKLWFHIDGAYCGSVIFSEKYKSLLDGVALSDSFSFNAHKMLGVPLTCSIMVTKHKEQLYKSFSNDADYLYQTDNDDFNLGKTSFQCGRRNDALKFWTLWKSIGSEGLGKIIDHQFYLAEVARAYIKNHVDYELYGNDNSPNICFNYKNISAEELCNKLYTKGYLMVGYGQFQKHKFIRLVTVNSQNTKEDILQFFKDLENFVGKEFEIEHTSKA